MAVYGWTLVLFFICFHPAALKKYHHYANDVMGREDRNKLMYLAEELLRDTKVKVRQITDVRADHSYSLAYEVGYVIGKIREKYKRMMDIYREIKDRFDNRFQLMPPGIWSFKPLHYLNAMEKIRTIEVEIDKLIHVLEMIPKKEFDNEDKASQEGFEEGSPNVTDHINPAGLRTRSDKLSSFADHITALPRTFKTEDELKRSNREEFELRNGHFHNWTLDQYYGIG